MFLWFIVYNGLIWFVLPVLLVINNDVFAVSFLFDIINDEISGSSFENPCLNSIFQDGSGEGNSFGVPL